VRKRALFFIGDWRALNEIREKELSMIPFPRILFPVDLSLQSRQAAPFVKALAKRFQLGTERAERPRLAVGSTCPS
jgi:hypothetical protein